MDCALGGVTEEAGGDWRAREPPSFEWPRLDLPVQRDFLREYDALGRNQPRVLGFMELVARTYPWMLGRFTGRVPDDMVARIADGQVEVPCVCKATTIVAHNHAVPCAGGCGRWFWYMAGVVRVGYEAEADPPTGVVP